MHIYKSVVLSSLGRDDNLPSIVCVIVRTLWLLVLHLKMPKLEINLVIDLIKLDIWCVYF